MFVFCFLFFSYTFSFSVEEANKHVKQVKYLCRADTYWLLEDDPGDTLQKGGCGQRAVIGPIIQRARKKRLCIKVSKGGLLSLQASGRNDGKGCNYS